MYYLKYRPRTLQEIDNTPVREIVTKILHSSHLPHAFLFVGQKGTGKTSTARIYAKAINCLNNVFARKGTSYEPCNQCSNCLSIDSSSSPDVIELDAASNRGIEEIRTLIKETAFSPMSSNSRVFIIDEAHMITHDAFNALLKTLEEPPPKVTFILATTNGEKVPKTVSSRCFIILFGRARKEDIKNKLKKIAVNEKLTLEDDVLDLIARNADYSFRDAVKTLEEMVIQNKVSLTEAQKYLGVGSKQNLLNIIAHKSLQEALQWLEEFNQIGGSIKHLIEELMYELHSALLYKNAVIHEEEEDIPFSNLEITQLMKLLQEAYALLRTTPIDSLPLEIALVEFYNGRKIVQVQQIKTKVK